MKYARQSDFKAPYPYFSGCRRIDGNHRVTVETRTEEDLIVYKIVRVRDHSRRNRHITGLAALWIPEGTLYYRQCSSAKIRAEHAITLGIFLIEPAEAEGWNSVGRDAKFTCPTRVHSNYCYSHTYQVGNVQEPTKDFYPYNIQCSSGIHFYTGDTILREIPLSLRKYLTEDDLYPKISKPRKKVNKKKLR